MANINKTTKEQFEMFKEECLKWIRIFELNDWEINFYHENPDNKNADCSVQKNYTYRGVSVYFSIDQIRKENLNEEYIKSCAKHEMIHMLLADTIELAWNRFVAHSDDVVRQEEVLVRKLEKIIQ